MTAHGGRRPSGRPRPVRRGVSVVVAAITLLALMLAGCVSVPSAGPIEKINGQVPGCQDCVSVEVDPPAAGDDPQQIVEGFLRATSNFQPNYAVAKMFLTKAAADHWSPEDGATIYRGTVTAANDEVRLDGTTVGTLAPDRSYTARDTALHIDFGVVKDFNGQWRIGKPPRGLMVAEYSFSRFYQPYSLYFVGNGTSLVPDPIYLPNLRSQANIASVLVKALLSGATSWLRPVVTSAVPQGTTLSGDAVTITDGVATVPLSDPVMQLNDQQRALMAAQVIYTLREAVGIGGVLFTVNQQPLRVPGGDESTFVVPADSVASEVDPIPFVAGEQVYAVRAGIVQVVSANTATPQPRPMAGDLGRGRYAVDSLAVSVGNTDIAVVSDGRTALRRASTATGEVHTLVGRGTGFLRPQFSRYGELWTISGPPDRQRIWMFAGDRRVPVVADSVMAQGEVVAFRVSPDGARMALIVRRGGRTMLGLARISRGDQLTVDGWRPLNTTQSEQPQLGRLVDVTWANATDLLVLGASAATTPVQPYRVSEDASRLNAEGEATNWDAVSVTVLLRTQSAIVVGRTGQSYRDTGTQWSPFLDKVSTIAFPG